MPRWNVGQTADREAPSLPSASSFPKISLEAQPKIGLHLPECPWRSWPCACASRLSRAVLSAPPLPRRRHFFRDFHPATDRAVFFLKGEAATQIISHFSPQELAALGTERPEQEGGGPGGGGITSRPLLRLVRTLEGTAAPPGGRCARSRRGGCARGRERCVLSSPPPSPALPLPPPLA